MPASASKPIEIGQKYLEKEARRLGVSLGKITKSEMEKVASEYGYSKMEDLYAALGYGKFSARQVLVKIAPGVVKEEAVETRPASTPEASSAQLSRRRKGEGDGVIKVRGIDDLMVYRAKCCNPIRGEVIVGYVTRGKGRRGALQGMSQRAEPDVRRGAENRSGVGARPRKIPSRCAS